MMRLGFKTLVMGAVLAGMAGVAPVMADVKLSELPSGAYASDPTHSSLVWKVSHMGLSNYTARFAAYEAALTLDTKDPTKSKLSVKIDPKSVRTDYPTPEKEDFDGKISGWLGADKASMITFDSTKIEKTGERTAKVTGNMTMLGVTKPLMLDVTMNGAMVEHPFTKKGAVGFSATGKLKRSDFGFTQGAPHLGDEVTFSIETEMLQK